jgi:membrane protease YdiL (CAAX protease family)
LFLRGGGAVVSVIISLIILQIFAPDFYSHFQSLSFPTKTTWQTITSDSIITPIWEELLFRYVPIEIARRTGLLKKNYFPLMFLTSIVFGWMHGSVANVFCQGIVGIFLYWVYIKNNYSYLSSCIVHGTWNFMLDLGLTYMF